MSFRHSTVTSSIFTSKHRSEDDRRETFKHTPEFTLTIMSSIIGLHNFIRFPFVAYQNGQGAFIILYALHMVLIGRPMFTLEVALGQFAARGNIKMFRSLGPLYGGIGLTQTVNTFILMSYSGSQLAFTLYYFSQSFHYILPWSTCREDWDGCTNGTHTVGNTSEYKTSANFYLQKVVLNQSDFTHGIGRPRWSLSIALFCGWCLAFLILSAGVASVGKVNCFLGVFPMLLLFVVLVEAFSLTGSYQGVLSMIIPKWEYLANPRVWYTALTHVFISLNLGVGTTSMYASFNGQGTGLISVAWVLCVCDFATSIMASMSLYAFMGHIASSMELDLENVMKGGELWVIYADMVIHLASPYLTSTLFFFMFITLGLGSLVAFQQLLTTQYIDYDPYFFKPWHLSGLSAIIGFSCGMIYITPQSKFFSECADLIVTSVDIKVVSWIQCFCVTYSYGLRKFCWDIEYMTQSYPDLNCRITWRIIPIYGLIFFIWFSPLVRKSDFPGTLRYDHYVIIWCVVIGCILPMVVTPLVEILTRRRQGCQKIIESVTSSDDWFPPGTLIKYKRFVLTKETNLAERKDAHNKCKKFWNDFVAKRYP